MGQAALQVVERLLGIVMVKGRIVRSGRLWLVVMRLRYEGFRNVSFRL